MSSEHIYESIGAEYSGPVSAERGSRDEGNSYSKTRRPHLGRRRGKAPQSVNGIHRRRRRKLAW